MQDTLFSRLQRSLSRVDALPFTPSSVGVRLVHWHIDRKRARAALDPTWSEIEERRTLENGGSILLSKDEDLGFPEMEVQERIEERLTPDPAWLPLAYRMRDWTLTNLSASVRFWAQRARRGWADADVVELGANHNRVLGEMLLHLADSSHGWPYSREFPDPEDWETALRHHGRVLLAQGWTERSDEDSLEEHVGTLRSLTASEEERSASSALRRSEEEAASERVRRSLYWVADHHDLLWD